MQLEKLEKKLGYKFHNIALLQQALSHRSTGNHSNERMEFLGDSVLNFVIAAELFQKFQDLKEGELSRLRASLVNGEILAQMGREFDLGDYLILGIGEKKSGGSKRSSIIADAMEAIIGAIYLDAGMENCRNQVLHWYKLRLEEIPNIALKDPKTILQEYTQANKLPLPVYNIISIEGVAHDQVFHIECRVDGLPHVTLGVGNSKRRAEQSAAELYLKQLTINN